MKKNEQRRGWDLLSDEERKICVSDVMGHIQSVFNKEIGIIAANEIVDVILQSAGPAIYNKTVEDMKKIFRTKLEGIEFEMDLTKRE